MVVPLETQERIVKQVEWYFSDENLLKDSFLMKHIHRNKLGFVSLKLVASFRKVKAISKDWRAVQASLLHSTLLELSEDKSKVRRLAPVPEVDYTHAIRSVIVKNYPDTQPNVQDIEKAFSKYGEVVLVRVLYPGKAIPLDVKPYRSKHPTIGKDLCILVEFESEEGAKKACERFISNQSWRDQVIATLLREADTNGSCNKKEKRITGEETHFLSTNKVTGFRNSRESSPSKTSKEAAMSKRKRKPLNQKGNATPVLGPKFLNPDHGKEKEYLSDSGYYAGSSYSPKPSPEPLRKFPSDQTMLSSRSHIRVNESRLIRQPLGPDGTKGFAITLNLPSIELSVSG